MLIDRITEISKKENYITEHLYGQQRAFSYQNRYLIHFNNFILSLIVATQNHDKSEKYDFAILNKEKENDEFSFAKISGIPHGVRVCYKEKDMIEVFNNLVKRDKES